jgi:hypothetical protein
MVEDPDRRRGAMSALGTDLLAVACIVGGAAVSGVTTMRLMDGHDAHARVACVGATVRTSPRVVVSMDGGKGAVIVAPRVRVHADHDCMAFVVESHGDVQVNMAEMRARMEEARARMDEARARMEKARAADGSALSAQIQEQVEKQLQEQMRQLDQQLAKLDAGTGR